jgi:hypothetical protein
MGKKFFVGEDQILELVPVHPLTPFSTLAAVTRSEGLEETKVNFTFVAAGKVPTKTKNADSLSSISPIPEIPFPSLYEQDIPRRKGNK